MTQAPIKPPSKALAGGESSAQAAGASNGGPDSVLKVFAGRGSMALARSICEQLKMPLGKGETERFPDGELLVELKEDVRGRDCFVVLSTCQPVNENLMELLIFADSLRRASAKRITAVIPYFGYARQDRKDKGRTPITAKLVANLITTAGYQRVLALDLHAAQLQGFFDLPLDHLAAAPVFDEWLQHHRDELGELVVVSPDVGNVKVANMYAEMVGGDLAVVHKRRISGSEVASNTLVGDVRGKTVLMVDDMISTGGTVCEAARVVMEHGARDVVVCATHAVMVGPAVERLMKAPISRIVVTDSIPQDARLDPIRGKLVVLGVGKLLAEAINHIHHNRSVSVLLKKWGDSKR
ncbi:MAG: ribose-phosphate pyrophosphokinase [Planctomycetota bacterium]|nr:ribose-phosphate pyrophosphokinase [Planctomycetota bacterium]